MIVCLRVDERLIHGQVAMTWTKELKLNGLVVASDEAASNEIQKNDIKDGSAGRNQMYHQVGRRCDNDFG